MKKFASVLAGTALLLSVTTAASAGTLAEKGEAELARLLEGRTAGEPVSCINAMDSNRIRVIEHVGIVYETRKTIYVARATHPRSLGPWDVPVINRFGSQLCKTDIVRTIDRSGGFVNGMVFLNDFVPYTKAG